MIQLWQALICGVFLITKIDNQAHLLYPSSKQTQAIAETSLEQNLRLPPLALKYWSGYGMCQWRNTCYTICPSHRHIIQCTHVYECCSDKLVLKCGTGIDDFTYPWRCKPNKASLCMCFTAYITSFRKGDPTGRVSECYSWRAKNCYLLTWVGDENGLTWRITELTKPFTL